MTGASETMAGAPVIGPHKKTNDNLKITEEDIVELRKRVEKWQQKRIDQIDSKKFSAWWDRTFGDKPIKLLYKLRTKELDVFVLRILKNLDFKNAEKLSNHNLSYSQFSVLFDRAKKTLIQESGCENVVDLYKLSRYRVMEKIKI